MDSHDEEILVFKEEVAREEEESNQEDEDPVNQYNLQLSLKLERGFIDAEGHGETQGTFRVSKKPKQYSTYAAYMTKLIEAEPPTFEEVANNQEWKDAMNEQYQ